MINKIKEAFNSFSGGFFLCKQGRGPSDLRYPLGRPSTRQSWHREIDGKPGGAGYHNR